MFPSFSPPCPDPGPAQKMPATATALDFFQLFVPDNCIQNMVTQTNMYAKKFQERFGLDEGWRPVTAQEMKAFLGFVTSTSVHRCESVLSIWSSGFFSNRSIALKMSQARFEKILKFFHIVAFRPSQGSNQGLYKIQPFLDSLQQSFSCTFRPSQTQVCAGLGFPKASYYACRQLWVLSYSSPFTGLTKVI